MRPATWPPTRRPPTARDQLPSAPTVPLRRSIPGSTRLSGPRPPTRDAFERTREAVARARTART